MFPQVRNFLKFGTRWTIPDRRVRLRRSCAFGTLDAGRISTSLAMPRSPTSSRRKLSEQHPWVDRSHGFLRHLRYARSLQAVPPPRQPPHLRRFYMAPTKLQKRICQLWSERGAGGETTLEIQSAYPASGKRLPGDYRLTIGQPCGAAGRRR
jgi:hypothetical protein